MREAKLSHCRSCGQPVYFLRSLRSRRTGKTAPIDAKPAPGGNIRVDLEAGAYDLVPKAERTGPLRINHFATCRDSHAWHGEEGVGS